MEKETNTVIENLQNEYLKIKDNLIRCGNIVLEYNSEEEIHIYNDFVINWGGTLKKSFIC